MFLIWFYKQFWFLALFCFVNVSGQKHKDSDKIVVWLCCKQASILVLKLIGAKQFEDCLLEYCIF